MFLLQAFTLDPLYMMCQPQHVTVLFKIHPSYVLVMCLKGSNEVQTMRAASPSATEHTQTSGDFFESSKLKQKII